MGDVSKRKASIHNKSQRRRRWVGLAVLFSCILAIFARQLRAAASLLSHDDATQNAPQTNATSAAVHGDRELAHILSKYNLTVPEQSAKVKIPDAHRFLAFLHIGKTGGSTISMHLREGCRKSNMIQCKDRVEGWTPNETLASRRIQSYYHMEYIPLESLRHYTTIVTAVRNPIDRFLSAFAFEHPANLRATANIRKKEKWSCFPSIGNLVKAGVGRADVLFNISKLGLGLGGRRKTPSINCTELAELAFGLDKSWEIVNASHPWRTHMAFGYREYYRSMPPDKELLVMRSESLWKDWVNLNAFLSKEYGPQTVCPDVPPFQENYRNLSSSYRTKEKWKVQTHEEQMWLCQLLHEEIRTYLMIVMRAVNLDKSDLLDAAVGVDKMCR